MPAAVAHRPHRPTRRPMKVPAVRQPGCGQPPAHRRGLFGPPAAQLQRPPAGFAAAPPPTPPAKPKQKSPPAPTPRARQAASGQTLRGGKQNGSAWQRQRPAPGAGADAPQGVGAGLRVGRNRTPAARMHSDTADAGGEDVAHGERFMAGRGGAGCFGRLGCCGLDGVGVLKGSKGHGLE